MRIENGWLLNADIQKSPNFNQRPVGASINLLVIHGISLPPASFGGEFITEFFLNRLDPAQHPYFEEISHLKVSAHGLIRRDGAIIQFVGFHERAWHAGQSCFGGEEDCNNYSIGIELEGADDIPYSEQQYRVLAKLTLALQKAYPAITNDRIAGHSDIAPGRKTDPGAAFDWAHYRSLLKNT